MMSVTSTFTNKSSEVSPNTCPSEDSASVRSLTLLGIAGGSFVEVYDPESRTMYRVPHEKISHHGTSLGKRMVCRAHSEGVAKKGDDSGRTSPLASEPGYCPAGSKCRCVHIDVPLSALSGDVIHVHYVYRDASLCQYERLSTVIAAKFSSFADHESLKALQVHGPHQQKPTEEIQPSRIVVTAGALAAVEALVKGDSSKVVCHCAHYYFSQLCSRGASCNHIHVVSVDPRQERDSTRPPAFRKRLAATGEVDKGWSQMAPVSLTSVLNARGLACLDQGHNDSTRNGGNSHLGGFHSESFDNMSLASGATCWSNPSTACRVSPNTLLALKPSTTMRLASWGGGARTPSGDCGESIEAAIMRQESYNPSETCTPQIARRDSPFATPPITVNVNVSPSRFMTRPPAGGIRIPSPATLGVLNFHQSPKLRVGSPCPAVNDECCIVGDEQMGPRAATLPFDDCPVASVRHTEEVRFQGSSRATFTPTPTATCSSPCACCSDGRASPFSAKVPHNRFVHNPYHPVVSACCRTSTSGSPSHSALSKSCLSNRE